MISLMGLARGPREIGLFIEIYEQGLTDVTFYADPNCQFRYTRGVLIKAGLSLDLSTKRRRIRKSRPTARVAQIDVTILKN